MGEQDYSEAALYEFLESAAKRGLLKQNTANSRRAAAGKVLSVLVDSEKSDLRRIDVDAVFHRFQNKQGSEYKPESLQVYLSRVKTSISDFVRWRENPSAFRTSTATRAPSRSARTREGNGNDKPADSTDQRGSAQSFRPPVVDTSGLSIPIPLREGLTVIVSNIPADLTKAEGERIAAILRAYAVIAE